MKHELQGMRTSRPGIRKRALFGFRCLEEFSLARYDFYPPFSKAFRVLSRGIDSFVQARPGRSRAVPGRWTVRVELAGLLKVILSEEDCGVLSYMFRRLLSVVPSMFLLSLIVFILIQLPPGDFVDTYAAALAASGKMVNEASLVELRHQYGLDQNLLVQYFHWIAGVLQGDPLFARRAGACREPDWQEYGAYPRALARNHV